MGSALFHDLDVDLLHVHLLAKFRRKSGGLEQLGIYTRRHSGYRDLEDEVE
jgi:hypothetical protein